MSVVIVNVFNLGGSSCLKRIMLALVTVSVLSYYRCYIYGALK